MIDDQKYTHVELQSKQERIPAQARIGVTMCDNRYLVSELASNVPVNRRDSLFATIFIFDFFKIHRIVAELDQFMCRMAPSGAISLHAL